MNQPNNPPARQNFVSQNLGGPAGGKKFRKFSGTVVSAKMPKTLVVKVWRTKTNKKYQKQFKVSKHYKVHLESGEYAVGDKVDFVECRPLSRDKRWRVYLTTH